MVLRVRCGEIFVSFVAGTCGFLDSPRIDGTRQLLDSVEIVREQARRIAGSNARFLLERDHVGDKAVRNFRRAGTDTSRSEPFADGRSDEPGDVSKQRGKCGRRRLDEIGHGGRLST